MLSRQEEGLIIEELVKVYPGAERPAVDRITVSVRKGEILALLGPNGAGKTTTVKMIGGLILPTSGRIHVMGADVVEERRAAVHHIGAVLEGARNLYWRLPAEENLFYFGSLRGVAPSLLRERVETLLAVMELGVRRRQEVRHFSRGMQQKLAIAAALLHDPQVLLLDEPTLGLDVHSARRIEETVRRMAKEEGKAILLTTHTMPLAERLADRIFVMDQGRQIAYDTTHRLLDEYNGHRQTIEIELKESLPSSVQAEVQRRFPGVHPLEAREGVGTRLGWPDADQKSLVQLLAFLDEQGSELLNVTRRRASLEEIFLTLTERKH